MLPDPRDKPFLSVAEIQAVFGWQERAVRSAIKDGTLPAIRVGKTLVPTSALLELAGLTPDMSATPGQSPEVDAAIDTSSPGEPDARQSASVGEERPRLQAAPG